MFFVHEEEYYLKEYVKTFLEITKKYRKYNDKRFEFVFQTFYRTANATVCMTITRPFIFERNL